LLACVDTAEDGLPRDAYIPLPKLMKIPGFCNESTSSSASKAQNWMHTTSTHDVEIIRVPIFCKFANVWNQLEKEEIYENRKIRESQIFVCKIVNTYSRDYEGKRVRDRSEKTVKE
jgi:hypothetical protein